MKPKEEATEQYVFEFDGETSFVASGQYCVYPHCTCQGTESENILVFAETVTAEVVSIMEKIAVREQEKDSRLFEGILSRVEHLEI